jgi:hypothetical protein
VAPLPVIANVYRTAFKWTSSEVHGNSVNVMHFEKSGSNPAALAASLDSHVTASMWQYARNTCSIAEVDITPLDGSSVTFPFLTTSPAKWKGAQTTGFIHPAEAVIIKLLTAKRGRSYRGRLFLPWGCDAHISDGFLDTATANTMTAAWIAFASAMEADGFNIVVASYKLATAEAVVAIQVEQPLGVQRRRQEVLR